MIVVGVDVHKRSHTFAAIDAGGRKLGEKTVEGTTAGHVRGLRWVRTNFGRDVLWGIEDCRQYSARLEHDLLDAGQRVVRVPPQLMARSRVSARSRGKSDSIDALAVARAVLREPALPVAGHDEQSRGLKLLVDRREDLVGQRTATVNRLLGRVHELDPKYSANPLRLSYAKHRDALGEWLNPQQGLIAELARDELADVDRLSDAVKELTARISDRVRVLAPALLTVPGCGELMAAKIVAETAGIARFKTEAAFACYAGLAPIPNWSGTSAGWSRMSRLGNRQINAALHRIAVTQLRLDGPGRVYYRRRIDAGDSPANARRCLKRRLARVVYSRLRADHYQRTQTAADAG